MSVDNKDGEIEETTTTLENDAIKNFINFIKIPTISLNGPHDGSYKRAVEFIESISLKMGFKTHVCDEIDSNRPILIVTVDGADQSKPALLFNCHYDVVPAIREKWFYDPFGGFVDEEQNIFGRGTQDMKSIRIQVLEALNRVKEKLKLVKTVHITFVPDEEIGSEYGMKSFVMTDTFKNLKIGMAVDEGIPSEDDTFHAFYHERVPHWIKVKTTEISLDCRISPKEGVDKFEKRLGKWIKDASVEEGDIKIEYIQKNAITEPTSVNSELCRALSKTMEEMQHELDFKIFVGATDARFVRKAGIPSIGFSPIVRTKIRLHDHNEYLNSRVFLHGIEIYERLIERLACMRVD